MPLHNPPSPADLRRGELLDLLLERHPESGTDIAELGDLFGELWNEAEAVAVFDHGQQILAVIEGRNYVGPGERQLYRESRLVGLVAREAS